MSKGGSAKIKPSPLENQTAQQLATLESDVNQPIRAAVLPNALRTLSTQNPFSTELPASDRSAIENQFDVAKNNIMNQTPGRGGALRQALVMNQNARASTVGKAIDDYRQRGVERALGLIPTAFPSASTQMGTATSLSAQDQQRNLANAQMAQQGQSELMGGLGGLMGLMFGGAKKPWIFGG